MSDLAPLETLYDEYQGRKRGRTHLFLRYAFEAGG